MRFVRRTGLSFGSVFAFAIVLCSCAAVRRARLEVAHRRAAVERGLVGPVIIQNRPERRRSIEERMAFYKTPALGVAVITEGRVDWAHAYGVKTAGRSEPATVDTLFQAASIGKTLTAVLALRLAQVGTISLDQDIEIYLKSWRLPQNEFTRRAKVTVRRILSHSAGFSVSGFEPYGPGEPIPTLLQELDGRPPSKTPAIRVTRTPGESWSYSGGGYQVLEQVLIDRTGRTFPELMAKYVLGSAQMEHTFYETPLSRSRWGAAASGHLEDGKTMPGGWHTVPELAAGGVWSTARDLAKVVIALQEALAGKPGALLSQPLVEQMMTRQSGESGLGVFLAGAGENRYFFPTGHNTGYRSIFIGFLHRPQGAVILANGEASTRLIFEVLRSIGTTYEWPAYRPVQRVIGIVDRRLLPRYAGAYLLHPGLSADVTTDGVRLFIKVRPLGPEPVELLPEGHDKFFVSVDAIRIEFVRGGTGEFVEMRVEAPGRNFRARRIPTR
jgi:CubicO group peptidase (beta-lactamase class C family)